MDVCHLYGFMLLIATYKKAELDNDGLLDNIKYHSYQ